MTTLRIHKKRTFAIRTLEINAAALRRSGRRKDHAEPPITRRSSKRKVPYTAAFAHALLKRSELRLPLVSPPLVNALVEVLACALAALVALVKALATLVKTLAAVVKALAAQACALVKVLAGALALTMVLA
jgi:hypothetical protein